VGWVDLGGNLIGCYPIYDENPVGDHPFNAVVDYDYVMDFSTGQTLRIKLDPINLPHMIIHDRSKAWTYDLRFNRTKLCLENDQFKIEINGDAQHSKCEQIIIFAISGIELFNGKNVELNDINQIFCILNQIQLVLESNRHILNLITDQKILIDLYHYLESSNLPKLCQELYNSSLNLLSNLLELCLQK
jgi:hypothetical protein